MKDDPRAMQRCELEINRRDFIIALAIGTPAPSLIFASAPGFNNDLIGDHEGRIKADAKLADQFRGSGFRSFHFF